MEKSERINRINKIWASYWEPRLYKHKGTEWALDQEKVKWLLYEIWCIQDKILDELPDSVLELLS